MDAYERQHREAIKQYGKEIRSLYVDAIRGVSQYTNVGQLNSDGDFFFRGNPDVNRAVNRLLTALNRNVQGKILQSVYSEWDRAVERNNEVCEKVFGETLRQLPPEYVQKYLSGNEQARQAFFNRRTNGLGLSEHVWNQQRQFKKELELALQYSIAKGKSAGETAQDIQQYLNEPDRLYRRVRDEFGVLRLSKAAQAYNPGQGTYRSSYKNALRLARNETNFSYQKSNQLKYQQQDFTVAMEIRVSSNHDPEDDKGGVSCIDLQGKYPKTFDWTYKWHVNCLCMSLSVQKTKEEIKEDVRRILRGEKPLPASTSVNYVGELPSNYVALATEYDEKFSRYKTYPRTFALNPVPEESSSEKYDLKSYKDMLPKGQPHKHSKDEYPAEVQRTANEKYQKNAGADLYSMKESFSIEERKAIKLYTYGIDESPEVDGYQYAYKSMRQYLSGKLKYSPEREIPRAIETISDTISKNPLEENTVLHRYVRSQEMSTDLLNGKVGDTYSDRMFTATSLLPMKAFGDFYIKIYAPKGSQAMYIPNFDELEVLIQKGAIFKILEKTDNSMSVIIAGYE